MKKTLLLASAVAMAAMPAWANKQGHHGKMMQEHFKQMDSNNDGFVSQTEHEAYAEKMFEQADTNNDGKISSQEMTAFKHQHMGDYKPASGKKASTMHKGTSNDTDDAMDTNENPNIKDTKPN